MGKAQSKRSVDITTEVVAEEVGRVEKIEDVDQLKPTQTNGIQHNEQENASGKIVDSEGEHEKDLATEKEKTESSVEVSEQQHSEKVEENTSGDSVAAKANATEELNENKNNEHSTSESKKNKKDKLKKKWSFRNISFGKKDKQKPLKKADEKPEAANNDAAVSATNTVGLNGECDAVPDQNATGDKEHEKSICNSDSPTGDNEEKHEIETVLNGSSEVKKPLEHAPIVEDNKSTLLETNSDNKSLDTEESPDEQKPSSVGKEDEIKLNGNSAENSTEIEVNTENDFLTEHSQSPINNSTPSIPPPLPISPQPSQVLEFALNDDNKEQTIDNKITPTDLNVTPNLQIPSVIETAPTPEIEQKNEIKPDIVKDISITTHTEISSITELSDNDVIVEQSIDEDHTNEVQISKSDEVPTQNISPSSDLDAENTNKENVDIERNEIVEEDSKEDKPIENNSFENNEQTVAHSLIEEVTEMAVELAERQINKENGISILPLSSEVLNDCIASTFKEDNNHGNCKENSSFTSLESTNVDKQSTLKENGTDCENETSKTESVNGVSEVIKTIEEIKTEICDFDVKINTDVEESSIVIPVATD